MTLAPEMTQLDAHLHNVQKTFSTELDKLRTWDDDQTKNSKFTVATRNARFDGIRIPDTGSVQAFTEAQQVDVRLSLSLIAYEPGSRMRDDPRGEAFKALAQDLVGILPSHTAVWSELVVGIGVMRNFSATVATDEVRAWAREIFPILQRVAQSGLECIERHNEVVDLIIQEQRAAMQKAEELTAELGEFKLT
jgi:hypothetical protein